MTTRLFVQATSGNVMLLGPLGNLRQSGNGDFAGNNSPNATVKTVDHRHKNLQEAALSSRPRNCYSKLGSNSVMGNIVRQPGGEFRQGLGLITSMDPEVLKNKGNERYKQGRYEEALASLAEAVVECKEAIRLDHSYQRAHYRLATIYFRLGETEKALYHYKQSGTNTDSMEVARAQALQKHLNRCTEARKLKEWNRLLSETEFSISSGADSVPQVSNLGPFVFVQPWH
ncbi:hypothetical protein OIU76_007242 [Salix suchowensis]|nr:hypothetical protein OIU76_007242 [Salix suchowensis]